MNKGKDYEKAVWKAMKKSYQNQANVLRFKERGDRVVRKILGFQPLAIVSKRDLLAVTMHFEPAIMLAKISRDNGLVRLNLKYIRGAMYFGKSVRIFPKILYPSGANRAQTVNFNRRGEIVVTRNADRKFFHLVPLPDEKWQLGATWDLPGKDFVQSALISESQHRIFTIESDAENNWFTRTYRIDYLKEGIELILSDEKASKPYLYGIGQRSIGKSQELRHFYVTDFRFKGRPGIYCDDGELVVPKIRGSGICFTEFGAAIVARYGSEAPRATGKPGALVYVPSKYFE